MRSYWLGEDGASAGEYALMLAIIGGALAASAILLAGAISGSMNNSSSVIASATSPGSASSSPPSIPATPSPPTIAGKNPNACPGCNSGNGNTDPGVKAGGVGH